MSASGTRETAQFALAVLSGFAATDSRSAILRWTSGMRSSVLLHYNGAGGKKTGVMASMGASTDKTIRVAQLAYAPDRPLRVRQGRQGTSGPRKPACGTASRRSSNTDALSKRTRGGCSRLWHCTSGGSAHGTGPGCIRHVAVESSACRPRRGHGRADARRVAAAHLGMSPSGGQLGLGPRGKARAIRCRAAAASLSGCPGALVVRL